MQPADAHSALGSLSVDAVEGTTLYDGIVKSARSFVGETNSGRVVIVVTDGNETREAPPRSARSTPPTGRRPRLRRCDREPPVQSCPLRRLARDTGGSYRGAGSSGQLRSVYAGIAAELRRTWRVEYLTSARGGDALKLDTSVPRLGAASVRLTIPGEAASGWSAPSGLLPETAYESFLGTQVVGARSSASWRFSPGRSCSPRSAALASRDDSRRIGPTATKRKQERQRLQAAAGSFRAAERTFGHWRHWVALGRLLERSDVPLRTVEFVYLNCGTGLACGLVAGILAQGTLMVLAAMAGGAPSRGSSSTSRASSGLRRSRSQLPDLLILSLRR